MALHRMARTLDGLLERENPPRMLVLMHRHLALEGIW